VYSSERRGEAYGLGRRGGGIELPTGGGGGKGYAQLGKKVIGAGGFRFVRNGENALSRDLNVVGSNKHQRSPKRPEGVKKLNERFVKESSTSETGSGAAR